MPKRNPAHSIPTPPRSHWFDLRRVIPITNRPTQGIVSRTLAGVLRAVPRAWDAILSRVGDREDIETPIRLFGPGGRGRPRSLDPETRVELAGLRVNGRAIKLDITVRHCHQAAYGGTTHTNNYLQLAGSNWVPSSSLDFVSVEIAKRIGPAISRAGGHPGVRVVPPNTERMGVCATHDLSKSEPGKGGGDLVGIETGGESEGVGGVGSGNVLCGTIGTVTHVFEERFDGVRALQFGDMASFYPPGGVLTWGKTSEGKIEGYGLGVEGAPSEKRAGKELEKMAEKEERLRRRRENRWLNEAKEAAGLGEWRGWDGRVIKGSPVWEEILSRATEEEEEMRRSFMDDPVGDVGRVRREGAGFSEAILEWFGKLDGAAAQWEAVEMMGRVLARMRGMMGLSGTEAERAAWLDDVGVGVEGERVLCRVGVGNVQVRRRAAGAVELRVIGEKGLEIVGSREMKGLAKKEVVYVDRLTGKRVVRTYYLRNGAVVGGGSMLTWEEDFALKLIRETLYAAAR